MQLKKSDEQVEIVRKLENNNVVVNAVAGSGKTTTILHIADEYKDKNILLLTYNTSLSSETNEKIKKYGLENISVYTYHAYAGRTYGTSCADDFGIIKITSENTAPVVEIHRDIIILDEAQDITLVLYRLACKIYRDNDKFGAKAKLCILGDEHQNIYTFAGADARYLIRAPEVFNFNNLPWARCTLSTSYRITAPMADFINNCMFGREHIKAAREGIKPIYMTIDAFAGKYGDPSKNKVFETIKNMLAKGVKPSDIFILAPSIKPQNKKNEKDKNTKKDYRSPIAILENLLKCYLPDVKIYVPSGDDVKLRDDEIKDRIVFSSFHQAKGRERKHVFVYGFDDKYYKYYNRGGARDICPNALYVAVTRASRMLYLVHHKGSDKNPNNYLPFIKKPVDMYVLGCGDFLPLSIGGGSYLQNFEHQFLSVTDCCKNISSEVLYGCQNFYTIDKKIVGSKINLRTKSGDINDENSDDVESISEINGIAIPLYWQQHKYKRSDIIDYLKLECTNGYYKNIKLRVDPHKENIESAHNVLYLSTLWNCCKTDYIFKLDQIKKFNWMTKKDFETCNKNMELLKLSDNSKYELECVENIKDDKHLINGKKLHGYIDCVDIDNDIIVEFKCVQDLRIEHYIQCMLYKYIYEQHDPEKQMRAILYNIPSGELVEISTTREKIAEMCKMISNSVSVITDDEFARKCVYEYKKYE